jgi:hypothetical protein
MEPSLKRGLNRLQISNRTVDPSMKLVVESIDIEVVNPTGVGDGVAAPARVVVHATENASARSLCNSDAMRVKFPKKVKRKLLHRKLLPNERNCKWANGP